MNAYGSNVTAAEAADHLAGAKRLVICTHAKPDGDALGSVAALVAALGRGGGREVIGGLVPPVAEPLRRLEGYRFLETWEAETIALPEAELTVIVDTGAWSQLGPMRAALEARLDRTLILDHHLSGDVPARHRLVEPGAAAACELVAGLIERIEPEALGTPGVAESLFAGLASDTGWFRFSNTTPRTHRLAAELMEFGVDHAAVYRKLEQTERPEKLALMARALGSLKFHAGGRFALIALAGEDFRETGARAEETERLIDLPQILIDVEVVALVCESEDGTGPVRVSLRSKPGAEAVDVAEVAARFGGGGHARAAGVKFENLSLAEAIAEIRAAVEPELS